MLRTGRLWLLCTLKFVLYVSRQSSAWFNGFKFLTFFVVISIMMISVYRGYCVDRPRFFPVVPDNSAAILQSYVNYFYVNKNNKIIIISNVNVYLWTC